MSHTHCSHVSSLPSYFDVTCRLPKPLVCLYNLGHNEAQISKLASSLSLSIYLHVFRFICKSLDNCLIYIKKKTKLQARVLVHLFCLYSSHFFTFCPLISTSLLILYFIVVDSNNCCKFPNCVSARLVQSGAGSLLRSHHATAGYWF